MKNLIQLSLLGILILPFMVSAQSDETVDLKARIEQMKTEKEVIKASIQSGEMTKENAQSLWAEKINELRSLKESVFKARINKLDQKFKDRAERHPEYAEEIEARRASVTTLIQSQRESAKAFWAELKEKRKNGELTREEIKTLRKEKRSSFKAERVAERAEAKEWRTEKRTEIRAEKKAENQALKSDLKEKLNTGEITKEEAREVIQEKRDIQKEKQNERMESLKERNPEAHTKRMEVQEQRMEKQEQRKETRTKRQNERQNQ